MADNVVSVDVELAIKKASADLEKLTGRFDGFAKKSEKSLGGVDKKLGAMRLTLIGVASQMAGQATNAVLKFAGAMITNGIKGAQEFENALNSFNVALQLSGQYSRQSSEDFTAWANSIERTTNFTDDAVLSAGALITNISRLGGAPLKNATKSALDLAAALKIDLQTAAQLVGKAAIGETGTLARYGIIIDDTGTKAEKAAKALELISSKFGGAAAKDALTYTGAVKQLANSYNALSDEFGFLITTSPGIKTAISEISKLFYSLSGEVEKNRTSIQKHTTEALGGFINYAADAIDALDYMGRGIESLTFTASNFARFAAILKKPWKEVASEYRAVLQANEDFKKKILEPSRAEELAARLRGISTAVESAAPVDPEKDTAPDGPGAPGTPQYVEAAETQKRDSFLNTLLFKNTIDDAEVLAAENKAALVLAIETNNFEEAKKLAVKQQQLDNAMNAAKVAGTMKALGTISSLQSSKNKELFFIGKAAAMGTATVNTFLGVSEAWKLGPVLGPILAPLVAIAGAAQVAGIAAQQPGFAAGGIVGGSSTSGDRVPIRVNSREAVLTMEQQQNLFDAVNAGNLGGGGSGMTVIIEGNVIADSPSRIDELAQAISDRVRFGNAQLIASGVA